MSAASFHCFGWVHGGQASTDCYATSEACSAARVSMKDRARPPCRSADTAACTTLPESNSERCFGRMPYCEAYREMLKRREVVSEACVARP